MKNTKLNKLAQYKMTLLAAAAVMGMAIIPITEAYARTYILFCDDLPDGTTKRYEGIGLESGTACTFIVIGTHKETKSQKSNKNENGK